MRTGRPNLQTLRAMGLKFAERIATRMARKTTAPASVVNGFTFPIRGTWQFGSSATTFGARGGAHQGIDVFARCGTPLVAASAGTVKSNTFDERSGNYLVITDTPTGEEQVFMHLAARSPRAVGAAVQAGTPIGEVGDTGNAEGCHLHFELWTAPGWYAGGAPHDPAPDIKAWSAAAGTPPG